MLLRRIELNIFFQIKLQLNIFFSGNIDFFILIIKKLKMYNTAFKFLLTLLD